MLEPKFVFDLAVAYTHAHNLFYLRDIIPIERQLKPRNLEASIALMLHVCCVYDKPRNRRFRPKVAINKGLGQKVQLYRPEGHATLGCSAAK
jgi:hypothetical protein